jgi:hypothetical protein
MYGGYCRGPSPGYGVIGALRVCVKQCVVDTAEILAQATA